MERTESLIDRTFRKYGEDFFGKVPMDRITTAQLEEARCFAFNECAKLTAETMTKQPKDTIRELFLNYLFGEYI